MVASLMHGPWFLVQRRTITKYWTVSSATLPVDVSREFMKLLLRIASLSFPSLVWSVFSPKRMTDQTLIYTIKYKRAAPEIPGHGGVQMQRQSSQRDRSRDSWLYDYMHCDVMSWFLPKRTIIT